MNILSAILVALSIVLGTGSASSAPAPTQEVSQVADTISDTDAEQAVLKMDAEVTWGDYFTEPMVGDTIAYTWVSYAYEKPANLPTTQVAVQSIDLGIWHVYEAQWLRHA